MKRFPWILALLLAVSAAPGGALTEVAITLPMRLEKAERVVIGTLSGGEGDWTVTVDRVLKGPARPTTIRTRLNPPAHRRGSRALYIESTVDGRFSMLTRLEPDSHVWNTVHLLLDPAPVTDLSRHPEHVDTLEVLGYLFDAFSVSCPANPRVEEALSRSHWEGFPWSERRAHDLHCAPNREIGWQLRVLEISPETVDNSTVAAYVQTVDIGRHLLKELPRTLALRIEPGPPARVGSLSASQAAAYLRDRLRSQDPRIARAALLALARMHDLDSVPAVIDQLDAPDEFFARTARQFLGWAGDLRALEPLCADLAKHGPHYPVSHSLSDESARALGKLRDERAAPYLEEAVAHGVEFAFYSLPLCGRAESIGAILQPGEANGPPNTALSGLTLLVCRSNKPLEPWMTEWMAKRTMSGGPMPADTLEPWRAWWSTNRDSLKLVRNADEALVILGKERTRKQPASSPGKSRPGYLTAALAAVLAGVVILGVIASKRRSSRTSMP